MVKGSVESSVPVSLSLREGPIKRAIQQQNIHAGLSEHSPLTTFRVRFHQRLHLLHGQGPRPRHAHTWSAISIACATASRGPSASR